jgi:hypothetical protein
MKVVKDGEWVRPKMTGYLMECCRCGAVHHMDFRIDPVRGLEMRGSRNDDDTPPFTSVAAIKKYLSL